MIDKEPMYILTRCSQSTDKVKRIVRTEVYAMHAIEGAVIQVEPV